MASAKTQQESRSAVKRKQVTKPDTSPSTCKRTYVNSEVHVWNMRTRNKVIDVIGICHEKNVDQFDVYSLYPIQFRTSGLGQDSKWYSFDWMDRTVLDTPQTDQALFKRMIAGQTVESHINNVFRSITFQADDGASLLSRKWIWTGNEVSNLWPALPRKVVIGFLAGMNNARGRTAMAELLENLFTDTSEMVTHMGGRATKDPCVRQVQFYPQAEMSSSSDSGPENILEEENPTRYQPKRRRPDPESPLTEEVKCKLKRFVPDLVVESMFDVNEDAKELLVCSVKSGQVLTARDLSQLKYELLPMLTRQTCAVGLAICSTEAVLMRLSLEGFTVKLPSKKYIFSGENVALAFMSMCNDTVHYARQTQLKGS